MATVSLVFFPFMYPEFLLSWNCAVSHILSSSISWPLRDHYFYWVLYVFFRFLVFMLIKLKLLQRKNLPSCSMYWGWNSCYSVTLVVRLYMNTCSQSSTHIQEQLESWEKNILINESSPEPGSQKKSMYIYARSRIWQVYDLCESFILSLMEYMSCCSKWHTL